MSKINKHPEKVAQPPLDSHDYNRLANAIARFFCELRKMDNTSYRADSIKVYFSSIAQAIKDNDATVNIYKDPRSSRTD